MSHLTHPIISSNADAILKHQAKFVTSSSDIVFLPVGRRIILLSLYTAGETVTMGPGGTTNENFGVGDDLETNFTTTVANIPIIPDTVVIKIDDVQIGTDNGAGVILGDPNPGDITVGSVVYSTGAIDVTFSSAPATDAVISVTYVGYITGKYITIDAPSGTTKWDLSAFFKNAPYSLAEDDTGFIVTPDSGAETVIAYVEIKGD